MSKENFSRRKALSVFGLGGLAIASGPLELSAERIKFVSGKTGKITRYGSVAAMQEDVSLKEGMLAEVTGYYTPGDGGRAEYLVRKASEGEETGLPLANGLRAELANITAVNYKMFGALGNKEQDDGRQIRMAHDYANQKGLPVVNLSGEFWIRETKSIPILGNVYWGHTVFHIDEQYNTKKEPRFEIRSRESPREISLDAEARAGFLSKLKPGVKIIPELAAYSNCLVIVADEKDRIGFRAGREGQSWAREELFYVEEHGRIGDIAWEFKDYTRLTAYPCNDNYLMVEGGTFYVSGDNPGETYNGYWKGGISISRSRTIIRNQWVGLEKGKQDVSLTPRSGFYSLSTAYDVTLENIRLIPWEQNRPGEERDIAAGTYGISGRRVMNAIFRRVTAEGSAVHWGVFGTNLNKNFRIEQCTLNRVDVHFHCWNLYIKDSEIGYKGITVTGGGELLIENTSCCNRSFINFRRDYGAKWDGNILIRNCRLIPSSKGESFLLNFSPEDFDYKYPIGLARTIRVEDTTVDYTLVPECEDPCWLMKVPRFSRISAGPRLFFPRYLQFRNIAVEGRERGLRLLEIRDPGGYEVDRPGGYDEVRLTSNSAIEFDRIQLEELEPDYPRSAENVHLLIDAAAEKDTSAKKDYEDRFSLYPSVRVINCRGFAGYFGDIAAELGFDACSVARLSAGRSGAFKGAISFSDCRFRPVVKDDGNPFYQMAAALGTRFTNCTIHIPMIDGSARPGEADRIDFVQLNKLVRYNHLNTLLGRDILAYCRQKKLFLNPGFIAMLKSHHELEPEKV